MNPDFAEWLCTERGTQVINTINKEPLKALELAFMAGKAAGLEAANAIVAAERERRAA